MNVKGKRALVTGGSSGIGLEIARELLRAGADVVITGRRQDAVSLAVHSLESVGAINGVSADVTTPEGRARTLDLATSSLGGLDILVNNAGGVRAGRIEAIEEEEIRQMVEVNLIGPILLTRAALPMLRKSGDALVVNVSSGIALVGMAFYSPYAAVKAGIAHFGEALRRELDGEGVRVLTVYPTATDTPMMATSGLGRSGGRETASAVAHDVIAAIFNDRLEVVRGDPDRLAMMKLNRTDQGTVDDALRPTKAATEEAARNHSAL
ncbi:SDR family NAD(P)-dependent oxidoreductase [Sphingomonas sp. PAMC 26621]|uniref:SDR family NAD(P)-dependent oxidoreductase n=1 Tax=Sphingomonas sp. PAMC 26621 TaxID=1112213 RepID=UPI00047510D5|nr:SDR family oxidoreductase [Sphingomonas sp. PAMC 26621]